MKQLSIARRGMLVGAGSLLAAPAIVRAQGQNGVALVIGNSKYQWEAPLPNVRRDAPSVAKRFQELGLKTQLVQDAGRDAMFAALENFKAASNGANIAVVYFAGHGASWEKDSYLVPVDTDLSTPTVVKTLIPVSAISTATKGAAHRLLIFDSCRNNPADGWRQRAAAESAIVTAAELAAASLHGPNTLVLFSTAPGRVAVDGPAGDNSPFAAAFLRQLEGPSIELSTLPTRLRRDLLIATEGRQVIWHESTYTEQFALAGARGGSVQSSSSPIDPARIVELPKAYVYARDKKLALPAGLVAIRPLGGSPHASKIGAFESTTRVQVGASPASSSIEPVLVVALSVDESGIAQTILCYRLYTPQVSGPIWGFLTVQFSKNQLNFPAKFPSIPMHWRWKEDNSGSSSTMMGAQVYSTSFARLDG